MSEDFGSMNVEEVFNSAKLKAGIPAMENRALKHPQNLTATEAMALLKIEKTENLRSALNRLATVETIMNSLLRSVWSGENPDIAILKIWTNTLEACLPLAMQAVCELKEAIVTTEGA